MSTAITTIGKRRSQCRHIFTDGHRCGSPALREEDFCYYHHTSRGRAAIPTTDLSQGEHRASSFALNIPNLAERSGIQLAIGEVLNRLASNELDPRRAGLLLYGLQIASTNLPQGAAPTRSEDLVDEIVTDPTLGTIAPPADYTSPAEARQSSSLIAQLLRALHPEEPTPGEPPPDTTILPNLHTATDPPPQNHRNIPPHPVSKQTNRGASADTPNHLERGTLQKGVNIMQLKSLLLAATLVALPASTTFAQSTYHQRHSIAKRQANQQARINKGVADGQITPGGAARADQRQQHIANQDARMRSRDNGHLTAADRHKLANEQNRTSQGIYDRNHNGVADPGVVPNNTTGR